MHVLYFTKSAGYEHSVVHWGGRQFSHSEAILAQIGAEKGIQFTFSKDGSLFSPEYLEPFDAIMFYTSGDLLSVGTDGHPAMTAEGKQALIDAVRDGKGFVGVHSAGDTFHTLETGGGNPTFRANRYKLHGDNADPYIRMLGGEFINHGKQQVATARVADAAFPGMAALGAAWTCHEEWYSNKEFADNLHVLLVMESATMQGPDYERPPYPLAWARIHGKGRVWFTGMGHREDVWDSREFQSMLTGALLWASGEAEADVTPNIASVTPQANVMPPERTGT
jgi:type 1 glutamine amidotransferase